MHLSFLVIPEKGTADWIQPILEINNSHTLPFQKRSIHQSLHLDLLDLLLKYRYEIRNSRQMASGPKKRKNRLHFSYNLDRLKNRPEFFFYHFAPLFYLFFWWLGIGNDIGNFEAEKVC